MHQILAPLSSTTLSDIAGVLRNARRILALCHVSPDGDALGSLLGLGGLLRSLPPAPDVTLACADPTPWQLDFLPGATLIVHDPPAGPWDAIVALDASDGARLGTIFQPSDYGTAPIIVIDHHVTNLRFGTLNYVDTTAAATCQILVQLADALDVTIDPVTAQCLLTGIVTDTISFRTSNVTPEVLQAAVRLTEAGATLNGLADRALNRRTLSVMRLWGQALSELHLEGHVLWVAVTHAMRAAAGVRDDEDGSLSSYLISAVEARIAAVFTEKNGETIEMSFRSRPGYDVAAVALSLGGGGHPQAAGCTLTGPLDDIIGLVVPLLVAAGGDQAVTTIEGPTATDE